MAAESCQTRSLHTICFPQQFQTVPSGILILISLHRRSCHEFFLIHYALCIPRCILPISFSFFLFGTFFSLFCILPAPSAALSIRLDFFLCTNTVTCVTFHHTAGTGWEHLLGTRSSSSWFVPLLAYATLIHIFTI